MYVRNSDWLHQRSGTGRFSCRSVTCICEKKKKKRSTIKFKYSLQKKEGIEDDKME